MPALHGQRCSLLPANASEHAFAAFHAHVGGHTAGGRRPPLRQDQRVQMFSSCCHLSFVSACVCAHSLLNRGSHKVHELHETADTRTSLPIGSPMAVPVPASIKGVCGVLGQVLRMTA